nr:hypothetical protein [Tanacetum cinerariifolium]
MFLTHSDEALEIEKFKRERENKIEFVYDYGSLNASYVNEKINFLDDYFQAIIYPDFDKIDSPFQQISSLKPYVPTVILEKIIIDLKDEVVSLLEKEKANLETIESLKSKGFESSEKVVSETENKSKNDCQVITKVCDSEENPKVIAPGMLKLSVSQSVSPISVKKISCASNGIENLDTLSSVRRPKPGGVMWMRKGSSNTVKADLSSVNHSNMNINVKRYSRKNLMACNNSDTCSAFDCNNARNALCNARMNASVDGLEVAFRKSTYFVRNEDGLDLLTGDRSSNLYTIALTEVASNSLTYLLAKASSSQSWLWHQRLSHLNFATINNLVKNNLVQGLPKMKFEKDHLCSACEQGKIHRQNGFCFKQATLSSSRGFVWSDAHEASDVIISFIKKTQVNLQLQVQRVRTDNGTEFKNKTLAKFFDECVRTDNGTEFKNKTLAKFLDEVGITQQFSAARTPQQNGVVERRNRTLVEAARIILTFIMKSSTMNVETSNIEIPSNEEEVFHESSESFQDESSSLNDDVHQSVKEVTVPSSNTQSISNNMVPNVDEASTSHNVLMNVCRMLTLMQSSVHTRGQLANSCLLSFIEPANVAEALRDVDWVSAMQDELDQFARLKFLIESDFQKGSIDTTLFIKKKGLIPLMSESFQAMARLWDFKIVIRAVFSSTLKSVAMMTGNLSSPSKNAYSRWG